MGTPVEDWVEEQARLTKPKNIYWCDGSIEEAYRLVETGLKEEKTNGENTLYELNHTSFPNSYLHRSSPTDVARTEKSTFISYPDKNTAGPNNNWIDPAGGKEKMHALFNGCMRGKTMYVLPYTMGHPLSPYSKACIQITDSCYVALNMRIMSRMGKDAVQKIGKKSDFVKGLHSAADLDPEKRFIMHFPLENLVYSINSGYGGNALLGKKCFALRIASWLGKNEGWLAEHTLIIGIENPYGDVFYILASFPSACGKTNLAMLRSSLPGYRIWTLGDDIAWVNVGKDGRLWAINPETGFFGVAPGTSMKTNPNMMLTLKAGTFYPTIFTNTAVDTDTNNPWWEGADGETPSNLLDWQGRKWNSASGQNAAHPNARFTVSIRQCPTISPEFDNPEGVPISAILFGCKRTRLVPLVTESTNWQNGVFCGARTGSETTAASSAHTGILRRDPMAMIPFCGYNMGSYFSHWLSIGRRLKNPPKIFCVNWFRQDESGLFLWPGFGENIRVMDWIIRRVRYPEKTRAKETPVGLVPETSDFEFSGLNIPKQNMKKLFEIKKAEWEAEINEISAFFSRFGDTIPQELRNELAEMSYRLKTKSAGRH